MRRKIMRHLGRKVGIGRFALPIWSIGLAVAVIGAVAGQVVGPILTGSTSGTITLVVEQAVTLDPDYGLGANPAVTFVVGTGDSATTRDDLSTGFSAAIEMKQGQRVELTLFMQNNTSNGSADAGSDASAMLELHHDASKIDIEVEERTGSGGIQVQEAQMSPNTWLLVVPADAGSGSAEGDTGFTMTIRPHDDIMPGYYEFTGRIIQTSGG